MKMILGMPFLSLSNTDIEFAEGGKFTWRFYTTTEALFTTSRVELINKQEFAKVALDENSKIFVVHIAVLGISIAMPIYFSRTS